MKSRDAGPWLDSGCTFLQVRIRGVGFTPRRSVVGLVLYCRSILHFMKKIKSLQEVCGTLEALCLCVTKILCTS